MKSTQVKKSVDYFLFMYLSLVSTVRRGSGRVASFPVRGYGKVRVAVAAVYLELSAIGGQCLTGSGSLVIPVYEGIPNVCGNYVMCLGLLFYTV